MSDLTRRKGKIMSIIITILILLLCHTHVWSADRQFTVEYVEPAVNDGIVYTAIRGVQSNLSIACDLACVFENPTDFVFIEVSSGVYTIQNSSNYCITVPGGSLNQNVQLTLEPCGGHLYQQWQIGSSPSTLTPVHNPTMCANVAGGSTSPGAIIQTFPCTSAPNEMWLFDPSGPGIPLTDLAGTMIYTDVVIDGNPVPDIIVVPATSSSGGGQISQTVCVPVLDDTTATHIDVFVTAYNMAGNESLATSVVQWPVAGNPACSGDTVPPAMPSNITVTQP